MTLAVCITCGQIKFGAFCACPKCGYVPSGEREAIYSLALSDHYFEPETLREIGADVSRTGVLPRLPPETEEGFRAFIRQDRMMQWVLPLMERQQAESNRRLGVSGGSLDAKSASANPQRRKSGLRRLVKRFFWRR